MITFFKLVTILWLQFAALQSWRIVTVANYNLMNFPCRNPENLDGKDFADDVIGGISWLVAFGEEMKKMILTGFAVENSLNVVDHRLGGAVVIGKLEEIFYKI